MAITHGPLKGTRILDLTQAHAGPFGTMLLGDLGAEVIKIESPRGDMLRGGDPVVSPNQGYMIGLNRNKKCIVLDLKNKYGKQAFYDLVEKSDVVYSNNRADVAERTGIDYDTLKKIRPDIIRANISGYGESGPYISFPSFDIIACGHGGILSISGEPDKEPVIPGGIAMADMMGGIFCTLSVLAALVRKCNTGKGMRVDINLIDGLMVIQQMLFQQYFETGEEPGHQGRKDPLVAGRGIFAVKDGCITLYAHDLPMLLKLLSIEYAIGKDKPDDTQNKAMKTDQLNQLIEDALIKKTAKEWITLFESEKGISCGPILNIRQLLTNPQLLHNKMIIEMSLKGEEYKTVGPCFRLYGETPLIKGHPEAPGNLGEHTYEILEALLHYSKEQIEQVVSTNDNNSTSNNEQKIKLVYENNISKKN